MSVNKYFRAQRKQADVEDKRSYEGVIPITPITQGLKPPTTPNRTITQGLEPPTTCKRTIIQGLEPPTTPKKQGLEREPSQTESPKFQKFQSIEFESPRKKTR